MISWGLGRGFTAEFDWVGTRDPSAYLAAPAAIDSRIAPVSRLVGRFIDACVAAGTAAPGFVEGYRVQCLIDAAWRAHRSGGGWIDVPVREDAP